MTEQKLCPFQSDSQGDVYCTRDKCMAWGEINDPNFDKCERLGHPVGCRLIPS